MGSVLTNSGLEHLAQPFKKSVLWKRRWLSYLWRVINFKEISW